MARRQHSGQAITIPAERPSDVSAPWPTPTARPSARAGEPRFVASVSETDGYFLDQYGEPLLVHGDSPWSLMTDLSPAQAELYFRNRSDHGFNAAIVSLVGAEATADRPTTAPPSTASCRSSTGTSRPGSEPYWDRVTRYLELAAENGITVFLYPIDGWTIGKSFHPEVDRAVPGVRDDGRRAVSRICPTSSGCPAATTSPKPTTRHRERRRPLHRRHDAGHPLRR